MGVFTKLTKTQIKSILKQFKDLPQTNFSTSGVALGTVNTYYKIIYSPSQVYFLKIDEVADLARLKNEITVFQNLSQQAHKLSYTIPIPLQTQQNKFYVPFQHKYALLFERVDGAAIFNRIDHQHLITIGQKMAELHKLKLAKAVKDHRFNLKGLLKTWSHIKKPLQRKHPKLAKQIQSQLSDLKKTKPKTCQTALIHADLFPENMHWNRGEFTGLIDFEAAGRGAILFDLAVAMHALCLTRQKLDSIKIKALLKGYQKIKKISQAEMKKMPYFLRLTCLRFLISRLKAFELPGCDPKAVHFKDYREYVKRLDDLNYNFKTLAKVLS